MWGKTAQENTENKESYHCLFNKRFKLSTESEPRGSSVIKPMENTKFDNICYNIVNPAETRNFDKQLGNSLERGEMFQTYPDYQKLYKM